MAKGNRVGVKGSNLRRIQQRGQDSEESDEEYKVTEDEDCDDSDECYSLDGDESEDILADFEESRRVVRSRSTRRTSSGRKGDEIKKPRKKRRVLYTKDDDDDDEEEEEDEELDDEDDADFLSLGRKADHIKKPREKKRISYTELDDEEEEDYAQLVPSGRRRNLRKKHQEKKRVSDTEDDEDDDDDDDDAEFMHPGRKVNQEKKLREKRKVSYTEEDDDDDDDDEDEDEDNSEFMSTSRKGNQIKETREKRTVSYKEDNLEEEDENDAEFVLSESDFVDDDDESPKMKKNESISKKIVGGGRKKSKKSKIKKPTRPKQRNQRFGQKSGSSKEKPATNKNQVDKRSKKIPRRRKPRVTAESDSDFVSSPSLDQDYTISEEEREQMREASVYCANLRAKLRSSSCGKQEEEPVFEQRKNPVRKGKEKVEEMKEEVGKQVCGICLSEEGKRTVRGVLNCCRHYFCFSCIMEWSKVESRCPLCKQRFATITKAAKSDTGFDLRTVVIPVPECDQVYQPSEEELRGYLDPYESVICTECHHGGEDALMLLCDICDSPAHTFCVGLGREVPEGNWYCEGCRPTLFGSLSSQRPTPTSDRRSSGIPSDLPSPTAGGFDLNELYVPETPLTQQTRILPEPRLPGGDFMPAPSGTVATTLRDRRRIHRQMHHRLLNNNRMSDLVASRSSRTPPSSSSTGIRLFGSQLDQPHAQFNGREDHVIMSSMHDINLFSPRVDQFGVQNSSLPAVDVSLQGENSGSGNGMAFDSRLGFAQLHPCTNRSSIGSDASLSPYACREAIGSSRTSAGGIQQPY